MEALRRSYCEMLGVDLDALVAHLDRLNEPGVADEMRALAHRLRGSGGAYGFAALSAAGAMAEDASQRMLRDRLEDLILAIRMARARYGL